MLAALLQARALAADAEADSDPPYALGETIFVTGERDAAEAAQDVTRITAEDIRVKGARTLDEALTLTPGVHLRIGAEGVPRVDVRGFRTRHVLLLLDGVPLNAAFDQQFDPSLIPTENVSHVTLTRGPHSVLYGQGALGGVVDVVTRQGTSGVQARAQLEAGDREPYLAAGSLSGAGGPVDFLVSGSATRLDGFRLSSSYAPTPEQGPGIRVNSDRQRNDLFANVGWAPRQGVRVGLTATFSQGWYGKPASVVRDPFDPFATPPRYVRSDDYTGFSAQAAARVEATPRVTVRGWAFVNQLDEQLTQYDDATVTTYDRVAGSYRQRTTSRIAGGALQPRWELGDAGVLTARLSAEDDHWSDGGTVTVAPGVMAPVADGRGYRIYSAALQYEVSPWGGVLASAGYAHHWQHAADRSDGGGSVVAGISWDALPDTRLRASFGHDLRFPTLRDLYDPSRGNTELRAERSDTWQLGVEQRVGAALSASATGFYTTASDLIQQDPATGRGTNLPDVRFAGVELAAAIRPVPPLLVRASYTFLHSEDRSRPGREEQQYTPRDTAALEASYDLPFGLTPYASVQYVANQFFYGKAAVLPVQKGRLADIVLVDVRLAQRLARDRVTVYVAARNLLDRDYETAYGFPQPGRSVRGGVEVRY